MLPSDHLVDVYLLAIDRDLGRYRRQYKAHTHNHACRHNQLMYESMDRPLVATIKQPRWIFFSFWDNDGGLSIDFMIESSRSIFQSWWSYQQQRQRAGNQAMPTYSTTDRRCTTDNTMYWHRPSCPVLLCSVYCRQIVTNSRGPGGQSCYNHQEV